MSPRLHGVRERLYGNAYDSLNLNDMTTWVRLFGNQNIGDVVRTNMQVAGQFASDQTFIVLNVYVRTNVCRPPMSDGAREVTRDAFLEGRDEDAITVMLRECRFERSPLTKAFDEWAHSTVLELVIGNKPMFTMNVYDLLGGPALGPQVSKDPLPPAVDEDGKPIPLPWRRQLGRPLIVPVRQNLSVSLTSPGPAAERLRFHLPGDIAPAPLLWVHLEGLMSRDVA